MVKMDVTAKIEAKVEVVTYLIINTLYVMVVRRKNILLTTVWSRPRYQKMITKAASPWELSSLEPSHFP